MGLALYLEDYHPSVLLHCWLGHLTCKIVSEMTYNVSSGTLNPTIPYHLRLTCRWHGQRRISRGAGEAAAPPRVGQNDFFSGKIDSAPPPLKNRPVRLWAWSWYLGAREKCRESHDRRQPGRHLWSKPHVVKESSVSCLTRLHQCMHAAVDNTL